MNIRNWFKRSRHELGRHVVPVFGNGMTGGCSWGSGILLELHGTRLVVTCEHVTSAIKGDVFVGSGGPTPILIPSSRIFENAAVDTAGLVVTGADRFAHTKDFFDASSAFLGHVPSSEPTLAYGFPVGHPALQVGAVFDPQKATASFRSLTYLTVTAFAAANGSLNGRVQQRLEWSATNKDFRRFLPLSRNLTARERGGWSGGPVVLSGSRELIGQVTHASGFHLWYNPMGDVLRVLAAHV